MKSYRDKRKNELLEQATLDFTNTNNLMQFISCILSSDDKPPIFEESYKFLFDEDEFRKLKEEKEQKAKELEIEKYKAEMRAVVIALNKKKSIEN